MRIGLAPWVLDESGSTAALEPLVRQCKRAERLGFHSVWIPESHFTPRGANPAPLLLLTAIAAHTQRLKLGTTSYLLPIRHPLHVAAEVAVLDRLSRGRVILGVGRGFRPATFDAFEIPRREKRDRFESALEVMRAAWRGEPVSGPAESAAMLSPRPVQQPHPPIWVAAFGPKALAQAGRLGLPYLASPMESWQRLRRNYALHREACGDGIDYAELAVPVMRTAFVSSDERSVERVRRELARQMEAMRATRPRSEEQAAPVDEVALLGPPTAIDEAIARYREELGVTHLIARAQVPGASGSETEASLELLAELGERHRA